MEDLIDIASSISKANKVFIRHHMSGDIYARYYSLIDGSVVLCWFTNTSLLRRLPAEVNALGKLVSKNSIFAVKVLNSNVGDEVEYLAKDTIKKVQPHKAYICDKTDLVNCIIDIAGDDKHYEYHNIDSFLAELLLKEEDIRENENRQKEIERLRAEEADSHRKGELTKELNKLKEKIRILTLQQKELSNLTKYIREQGSLRYHPLLDPVQNRIKTQNLFDGKTLIIDGGPGTGKTTTMIQRLKYLTDDVVIKEDADLNAGNYQLNNQQRNALLNAINADKDWIFFSPSRLLKNYLEKAMDKEGLSRSTLKVWNWNDYRIQKAREVYKLVLPGDVDKSPFLFYNGDETLFKADSDIIREFSDYYTEQLQTISNKLPVISQEYNWYDLAKRIQTELEKSNSSSINHFIWLFNFLHVNLYLYCISLIEENRKLVNDTTDNIQALININPSVKEEILSLVTIPEPENDEDTNEDNAIEDKVHEMLRKWLRQYCYLSISNGKKLSERNENISKIVLPLLDDSHKTAMKRIGELCLFEQFAKYTNGIKANMLRSIPTIYKRFRQQAKTTKSDSWNQELLAKLISTKKLHPQEQSLIIGFINNLVKAIIKNAPNSDMNHTYFEAYKELSRPIIGIDEATDFSKYDIYAIESLLSVEFNSLTLCGDMMQRLTVDGIRSWNDIGGMVNNPIVVKMNKSYRQSSRLLDVAKNLYKDSVGVEPNYSAHMKSKDVPLPLAFVSDDEDDKVEWIGTRIKEVNKAYDDRLPSIAIFLNSEAEIPSFIERLKETAFIANSGIEVVNGYSAIAGSINIRVYAINVVKGMEFDVVFFHNIDKANTDEDLIKRYIYVGVSRAAFFLGITMSEDNKNLTKYFSQTEKWG